LEWQKYVELDKRYLRPAEVDILMGDASKAKKMLGWEAKTKFKDLVRLMVDADIKMLEDKLAGKVAAVRAEHH
jgi:GDPmannose 4,6-dehydratase